MRIALIGYGRMGRMVADCAGEAEDLSVAGIVDEGYLPSLSAVVDADVAIDFSYPGDLEDVLAVATAREMPLVIGRTGLSDAQMEGIREASGRIAIVQSGNFSIGIAVMRRLAAMAAEGLGGEFDIEIVETHHRKKLDAPSGTARMLVQAVDPERKRPVVSGREGAMDARRGEIGVHALRGGTVCGTHSVSFFGEMESIEIVHRAEDRRVFAVGALKAARFLMGRAAGLYTMDDVLFAGEKPRFVRGG